MKFALKLDLYDLAAAAGVLIALAGLFCWHGPAAVVAVGVTVTAGAVLAARRRADGPGDEPAGGESP